MGQDLRENPLLTSLFNTFISTTLQNLKRTGNEHKKNYPHLHDPLQCYANSAVQGEGECKYRASTPEELEKHIREVHSPWGSQSISYHNPSSSGGKKAKTKKSKKTKK